ncbi:uncharacterized protein F5891DRAFT_1180705 [Suillus fuscotomentosus]|uniref:Uncharacterized protein n=1 Tax=Suillus fuscotomentosus TaxID=1912939 RepID=A0AAD4HRR1_9AGAM|nr:uncharacterized protein F5891DRAFT_1180705 [Suillus fuscotomentosus]KAG1907680.1 hypothetical protein F5891DRAFT_1180705 [Suillus fuscotomentosus]
MNAASLISTSVARVIMTGVLSAVLFNKTVVRYTRHALKEAEQASPQLAVVTLCISTLALLHASDRIACDVLGLAETCTPTTSSEEYSLATARDDARSPAFSHDDTDDFTTPLSSPSISSPGNSLDSIVTLTSSSTVSKLGNVFRDITPSPPAVVTGDSDNDVVLRKWTMETAPEFSTPTTRTPENILNSIIKRMRYLSLSDSRSFPSTPTRA